MFGYISKYFAYRKARKRLILLGRMIDSIDKAFNKKNIPRHDRKQFWESFIKYPQNRQRFIDEMKKGLGL